jgi:hypothetical protein
MTAIVKYFDVENREGALVRVCVEIEEGSLRYVAETAARNRSGRSKYGPAKAKVVRKLEQPT